MGWVQEDLLDVCTNLGLGLAELISVWGLFECMAQWE